MEQMNLIEMSSQLAQKLKESWWGMGLTIYDRYYCPAWRIVASWETSGTCCLFSTSGTVRAAYSRTPIRASAIMNMRIRPGTWRMGGL
jgi:hypothetical protein